MTGRVLDITTQAPVLAYVWNGNDAVAMTDAAGRWSADVSPGATLRFTGVGYSTLVQSVADGDTVYMESTADELPPVVVTPSDGQAAEAGVPWGALLLLGLFVGLASNSRPRRGRGYRGRRVRCLP